jgi:U4/U6.U5 tri-snRNP-associated protein 2
MRMTERRMRAAELMNDEVEREKALVAEQNMESFETVVREMPFLYLTLDVPAAPLFQDIEAGDSIIPQVPLFNLLNKFDGETEQRRGSKAFTYKLLSLPKYVILYIKRFTKNNFFLEKNPTIVNFPVKNLELKDCMSRPAGPPALARVQLCVQHRSE